MTVARDRATSPPPSSPPPPPPLLHPTYQAFLAGFGLALVLVASLVTYFLSRRPRYGVSLLPKSDPDAESGRLDLPKSDPGAESGRLDLPEAARHALPSSGYEGGQRSGAASEVGLAAGIHAALASGEPAAQPASNVR